MSNNPQFPIFNPVNWGQTSGEVQTIVSGCQGPTGPEGGPVGPQGVNGVQGTQGQQGVMGWQGEKGIQGHVGVEGRQGTQGEIGYQGLQGVEGHIGVQGWEGVQGQQGVVGQEGKEGPEGVRGVQGTQGWQGSQGDVGLLGYQGVQGVQGYQGSQGDMGVQGRQGRQGEVGTQGRQGKQGAIGVGVQGWQGLVGVQGSGALYQYTSDYVFTTAVLNDSVNPVSSTLLTDIYPSKSQCIRYTLNGVLQGKAGAVFQLYYGEQPDSMKPYTMTEDGECPFQLTVFLGTNAPTNTITYYNGVYQLGDVSVLGPNVVLQSAWGSKAFEVGFVLTASSEGSPATVYLLNSLREVFV